MALALFDLDNTLLAGDSDYLWGQFLVARGVVDADHYERTNQAFYDDYRAGRLDIDAFLRFALAPLAAHPLQRLLAWRADFMREAIEPIVTGAALALIEQHRSQGDDLVIITATNRFVTEPIAARFGIQQLIATEPEFDGERYTGRVAGRPAFANGKVERLDDWLAERAKSLTGSTFYSDSINDLPLLERVDHPVATNPDARLAAVAAQRGWPVLNLHDSTIHTR
ncbi:MAG: HAD family hydrolase [Chromatiales bacterium]|nr:HAD family hydrolase [Chromatiales bacterium]